jgi:ABC-type glycerol-3-phosphate transport system substrate-binding protein
LLAAACGESEDAGGGETQPAAQPKPAAQTQAPAQPAMTKGPKTIGFHTDWVSPKRAAAIDRALKIWEQMHPEWTIQPLFVPGMDDNLPQVVISMAAGTEGDITLWEMYAVELWASRGAFLDVTAAVKKLGYNIEDHYYAPWTAFYQGKQIGMPFQWNVQYWQFNKTIFEQQSGTMW